MPDAPTYALFVAAALALLLVPGPAVIYIVARSVSGGRLTGLVSVLGDSRLLGGRFLGRKVARRGLPGLPRPQADPRARRRGRGDGTVRGRGEPLPRLLPERARAGPQPQGRALLPRLLAAVHRSFQGRRLDPGSRARRDARLSRDVHGRFVRAARRYGRRLDQEAWRGLAAGRTLRHGWDIHSPGRRGRDLREELSHGSSDVQ